MNIGVAIKWIRKKLLISQQELASKCHLTQTSLSQIETGAKRPSRKTIDKVCSALDIPEPIIYLIALQDGDIPESKKQIYRLIYPSLRNLALEIVSPELREKIKQEEY